MNNCHDAFDVRWGGSNIPLFAVFAPFVPGVYVSYIPSGEFLYMSELADRLPLMHVLDVQLLFFLLWVCKVAYQFCDASTVFRKLESFKLSQKKLDLRDLEFKSVPKKKNKQKIHTRQLLCRNFLLVFTVTVQFASLLYCNFYNTEIYFRDI